MTVDFNKATLFDVAWVYRCEPDSEYSWVTNPEWFDDIDTPVTTTRQRWLLVEEQTVVFHPRTELCPECDGEGLTEVDRPAHPDHGPCPLCGGDGGHPLAGQMEILP